ncbi:MAG: AmmeMemoRadiSam system radical SAM enzyme [Saccharofermentanales bacterium]
MIRAMYWEKSDDLSVVCRLCPHFCKIGVGKTGICGVRENMGGVLFSMNAFRLSSIALDPIEKKPLYRFHPGSRILSIGSTGCNLACPFCQNSSISKEFDITDTTLVDSDFIVEKAKELLMEGNIGVAYTYNEPVVWYETVFEMAKACHQAGLLNVMVTNGYISEQPLMELLPYIDAMNIDLKSFSENFYRQFVKGSLSDVKKTIEVASSHCHVELTTLVIPDENDSEEEMRQEAAFIASINPQIPLHLSRFFPHYKMADKPVTEMQTLLRLQKTAKEYLEFVYLGNV